MVLELILSLKYQKHSGKNSVMLQEFSKWENVSMATQPTLVPINNTSKVSSTTQCITLSRISGDQEKVCMESETDTVLKPANSVILMPSVSSLITMITLDSLTHKAIRTNSRVLLSSHSLLEVSPSTIMEVNSTMLEEMIQTTEKLSGLT